MRTAVPRVVVRVGSVGLLSVLAAGCHVGGGDPTNLYQWFRFDGPRTWTWASDDPSIPFVRVGTLVQEEPRPTGVEVFRVDFHSRCVDAVGDCLIDADVDGTPDLEVTAQPPWRFEVDPASVVAIRDAGGQTFEPPVPLAKSHAMWGAVTDPVESGGVTYTATWDGDETCPAKSYWTVDATRPACLRLIVDGQGGESPVTGTWWVTGGFGFVATQLDVDGGALWSLSDFAAE